MHYFTGSYSVTFQRKRTGNQVMATSVVGICTSCVVRHLWNLLIGLSTQYVFLPCYPIHVLSWQTSDFTVHFIFFLFLQIRGHAGGSNRAVHSLGSTSDLSKSSLSSFHTMAQRWRRLQSLQSRVWKKSWIVWNFVCFKVYEPWFTHGISRMLPLKTGYISPKSLKRHLKKSWNPV
jgi:hypothetical protein